MTQIVNEESEQNTPVQDGFYQVMVGDMQCYIFRVRTNEDGSQTIAKAKKYGSRTYTPFGIIRGEGIEQRAFWKDRDYNTLIMEATDALFDREASMEAGRLYAKSFGRCYVCNRPLTDPHSLATGIGPDCAGTRKHTELSLLDAQ
jgi:hypothetical protein